MCLLKNSFKNFALTKYIYKIIIGDYFGLLKIMK